MIRNQKSYEDARDTVQFNVMSVSSGRKTNNIPFKRDQLHYPLSPGNLQDGMSFSGTSSLPLTAPAAPVPVPSGPSPLTQHTPQYLQGNSLSTGQTHPAATTFLTAHGQATSTQTGLSLSSHSQGPTPASTPPAVPNDPKVPNQYQSNYTMNNLQPVRSMSHPQFVMSNRTHGGRGGVQPLTRAPIVFLPSTASAPYPVLQYQNHPISQMNSANIISSQQPFAMSSTNTVDQHHHIYYSGQGSASPSPAYNPGYNNVSRMTWSNPNRSSSQATIHIPHNPIISNNPTMYQNMATVPTMNQPQQQQQQFQSKSKKRPNAIPILHPETGQEITADSEKPENEKVNNVKNKDIDEKVSEFKNEVKQRAKEPSSNYSNSNLLSSYINKDANITNGTAPPVPYVSSGNEWKSNSPINVCGNASTINDQVDSISTLKSTNVSASVQSAKMDYKKPTREDRNVTSNETSSQDGGKSLDKEPISSWQETTTTNPIINISSQPPSQRVTNSNKKISNEAEIVVSSTTFSSSVATNSVPNIAVSNNNFNKESTVTNSSLVVDNNIESVQKNMTKQNIQAGVANLITEEVGSSKSFPITKQATTASVTPLPSSQITVPATVPSPAQSNTNMETKPSNSASQNITAQSNTVNVSVQNIKSSTSTASSLMSEKQSSVSTQSTSFPLKPSNSASVSQTLPVAEKVVKEEKPNPSTKPKSRGREVINDNSSTVDHHNSGSKNKTTQSLQKNLSSDTTKSVSTNITASVSSKQINGETADSSNISEGKSGKKNKKCKKEINKKGSEKEGSDMDMFTNIEKPSPNIEKIRGSEKISQPSVTTHSSNLNTSASNRKTNSSQKSIDVKENVNVVESKEKVVDYQNIPSTKTLSVIQDNPINKTEKLDSNTDKPQRRKYDIQYMMNLRLLPQCNLTVNLKSELPNSGTPRNMSQNGYSGGSNYAFLPPFVHQQPCRISSRKSQHSMKRDRPNQIHVSISLKDDVPLRQSKDAWKPARFNPDLKNLSKDEKKTEELYRAVRGILNKLTPEKFPKLVEKIRALPIDDKPRLQGVIDLVFQKAVDEPGFCKWYAKMCEVMQSLTVMDEENQQVQSFRVILITKCQERFENDKADELDSAKKLEEINNCTDPEKKKELQLLYEEIERKCRRKSVGNCRFIGELFKLQMLTAKIMIRCVSRLLNQIEEESLECLCKLLSTIGKDLEGKLKHGELDGYFNKMQEISEQKKYKVSSRIRFMLQDVIDLRKNDWVPRREMDNPKTIDQINREIEKKEFDNKMSNMLPRRTYDDYNKNRDSRKNLRNDKSSEEWHPNKNYIAKTTSKIDRSKFFEMFNTSDTTTSLGAPQSLASWKGGVRSIPSNSLEKKPLDNVLHPSLSLGNNSRNVPGKLMPVNSSEKLKSYPVPREENESDKLPRSSSSQNINSVSRESSIQKTTSVTKPEVITREDITRYCKTILNEYLLNNDLQDSICTFEERFKSSSKLDVLDVFINITLEQPKLANHCGKLIAALHQKKIISQECILDVLLNIVNMAEDILMDYPHLWAYLAEILCPLFIEDCLSYNEFKTAFVDKVSDQETGGFLLTAVTKLLNNIKNERTRNSIVNEQQRIFKLLFEKLSTESFENITKCIDENVENSRNNPPLVSALTKVVCEFCSQKLEASDGCIVEKESSDNGSSSQKEFKDIFEKYHKFFKLYIENKEELEMHCLQAVQEYAREKNYPQGFLLQMFLVLYDSKSISSDSFLQWKKKNEGPLRNEINVGVAMMSLTSFFNYLTNVNAP